MNPRNAVWRLAILLVVSVPLALAQGTYTQIDYPGADFTTAFAINTAGDVVGVYGYSDNTHHGFLLSGGHYTAIDYPGSKWTQANAINDSGQIVGITLSDDLNHLTGFLYDIATGVFTDLVFPGSSGVSPTGINNAGTIVGGISFDQNDKRSDVKQPFVGFELSGGLYRRTEPDGFSESSLTGINDLGEAVGGGYKFPGWINFSFAHGKFNRIKIPGTSPRLSAINNQGAMVGSYSHTAGVYAGFLFQAGVFQRLIFPRSYPTLASGINDSGVVVGSFTAPTGGHGFIWTPPAGAHRGAR